MELATHNVKEIHKRSRKIHDNQEIEKEKETVMETKKKRRRWRRLILALHGDHELSAKGRR